MLGTYSRNDENFNFNFNTKLSASDKVKFVNSVTSILVGNNYNSIIRDLIFDFYVVDIFTDVDTSELVGDFVNNVEKFLEETNIVDIVKTNAEYGLINELNKAVDLNIEYHTGIHTNPLNEALTSLVNTLERKVNEIDLDSMMEMANMFSGITGELTPENIVNAYMKSDMHKKNLDEIEESKKKETDNSEKVN